MKPEKTPETQPEQTTEQKPELSNADVKSHPLFAKLTQQLSETQNKLKAIEDSKAKEQADAEQKRLEEQGKYSEALEKAQKEYTAELDQLKASMLQKDLTSAFLKAGFTNDTFIRGATLSYNPEEHGDVDAFVKGFADDEANKMFMAGQRTAQKPPVTPTANDKTDVTMTEELATQYAMSDDPEKRKQSRDFYRAKFKKERT